MRYKYTVTTLTTRCPHCGGIIDEKSKGTLTPLYIYFFLFGFPILIPYWIIKYLGFKYPDIPSVGEKYTVCPYCSLPIRTNNVSLGELSSESLLNYQFKYWFWITYVLGGIFGILLLLISVEDMPIVSVAGLFALLSLVGVLTLVIVYRCKLHACSNAQKNKPTTVNKSAIYCRKCGKRLISNSRFCDKCGEKVVDISAKNENDTRQTPKTFQNEFENQSETSHTSNKDSTISSKPFAHQSTKTPTQAFMHNADERNIIESLYRSRDILQYPHERTENEKFNVKIPPIKDRPYYTMEDLYNDYGFRCPSCRCFIYFGESICENCGEKFDIE